jgi:hypothetical protein
VTFRLPVELRRELQLVLARERDSAERNPAA